jgi:hypothetical protein
MAFDSTNYINTWNNSSVLQGQFPNVNDYVDLFRTSGYTPATNAPTTSTPPSGIQTLLQDIDPTINTGDSNENRDVITDPFSGLGYSSENFGLGTNKDLSDYEADAAKVGRTMAGQLNKFGVNVFGALKNIPTPMNLAIKGMQAIQEYQERKAAEEAAAKAAEVESMRASNEAAGRGGYQSSWGNVDSFMSGEGTSGNSGGMGSADPGGSDSMGSHKDGGRIGFADGGSGDSSGIYGLLKQGIKNIEKGGLDSLFGERVSLAGGGSAGQPPITAFPIIDKPDENLTAGISPTQNPFVSYAKQFDTFGGQAGVGIYKEKNMDPNFGIGFSREVGPGRFSGGVNYTPGMNPEADFRYIQQSPSGEFSAGLNYNDNQGPRAELQYRKEFKDGGRIGYAAGGTSFAQQSNAENIKERSDQMEQIKRDMEDRIKSGSRTQGLEIGQLTEDMYGRPKTEYNIYNPSPEAQNYAAALNQGLRPEQIKAVSYYNTLRNNFGDEGMMLPEAMGGSGLMGGSEPISPNNSLSNPLSVQNFFQTPKEMFALYQEGLRRSMMQGDSEVYFDPDKTYDAGDYVSPKGIYTFRDIDPNVVNRGMMVDGKEYSSEQDAIDAMGVERYNKFMATGGRVSLKNGGLATMFRLK